MIFAQLIVNFDWFSTWRAGDITTAFLQGRDRDIASRGRLYLELPSRPLAGVESGSLLEVTKSVYGLPDAPRAWWEELIGYMREIGFRHAQMDPGFMI